MANTKESSNVRNEQHLSPAQKGSNNKGGDKSSTKTSKGDNKEKGQSKK
jgi:hypothetical protein